jgi:transposase
VSADSAVSDNGQQWPARGRLRDADWLRQQYVELGRSRSEIASLIGVADSTVSAWLWRHDIPMLDATTARRMLAARERPAVLDDADLLREEYWQTPSIAALADRYGVSASTVRAAMRRHDIATRTELLADRGWLSERLRSLGVEAVASQLSVSTTTVYRWARRLGLTPEGRTLDGAPGTPAHQRLRDARGG